ncbi:hypothetical protein [Loigolactobacillus backii]|uniref:hypothetical protein n=1 Tax=Loigolactobacillus backii TaxID=375175 RepID=UPI0007F1681E|nr:hypothetical protein [Loigolactobacillus backii]ANK59830.1 hypothetical protein AYR52_05885 [Loigolactobacillus backii]
MNATLITAAIALGAVISPAITTWINNHFKLKYMDHEEASKNQEFLQSIQEKQQLDSKNQISHIKTIYEKYASYTSTVIATNRKEKLDEQSEYFGLIQLYLPQDLLSDVQNVQNSIINKDDEMNKTMEQTSNLFLNVLPRLNDEVAKLQALPKQSANR